MQVVGFILGSLIGSLLGYFILIYLPKRNSIKLYDRYSGELSKLYGRNYANKDIIKDVIAKLNDPTTTCAELEHEIMEANECK